MSFTESTRTFFRQSGWMIVANTVCGVFMAAVHPVVQGMPPGEYGVFFTMLRLFMILSIPAAGLQTVFAQQAAAAVSDAKRRELAAASRAVLRATFVFWLLVLTATAFAQPHLVSAFKISNPAILIATVLLVLFELWRPVLQGLLQGEQNFLWLGWSMILNGVGRFAAVALLVVALGFWASGAMFGAVVGIAAAVLVAAWGTRRLVVISNGSFQWKPWLAKVAPLTMGAGAIIFVLNADMLVVQSHFAEKDTPFYAAGAMIGQALVLFTAPIVAVMFPKIAQSAARSQRSDALKLTLITTGSVSLMAALVCTALPSLPLRILFFTQPAFLASAPLVPWFAWAMLPVTIANALTGNLLARGKFGIVPWLVAIAVAYGVALVRIASGHAGAEPMLAFRAIVQLLSGCGVALCAIAAVFTWRETRSNQGQ